jgi:hypothetical protein
VHAGLNNRAYEPPVAGHGQRCRRLSRVVYPALIYFVNTEECTARLKSATAGLPSPFFSLAAKAVKRDVDRVEITRPPAVSVLPTLACMMLSSSALASATEQDFSDTAGLQHQPRRRPRELSYDQEGPAH